MVQCPGSLVTLTKDLGKSKHPCDCYQSSVPPVPQNPVMSVAIEDNVCTVYVYCKKLPIPND